MIHETLNKCFNVLSVQIIISLLMHKDNVLKLTFSNSIDQGVELEQFFRVRR
jgi:hypothetical protein